MIYRLSEVKTRVQGPCLYPVRAQANMQLPNEVLLIIINELGKQSAPKQRSLPADLLPMFFGHFNSSLLFIHGVGRRVRQQRTGEKFDSAPIYC